MTELSHNSPKPYLASVPSSTESKPLASAGTQEYPQSTLSLKLRLGDIEMSWTLRGDDSDVALRLPRALATIRHLQAKGSLPAPAAHQPAPASSQPPGEERADWCPVHHVAMIRQSNAQGSWYSHRLPEGGFCKGKPKRAGA